MKDSEKAEVHALPQSSLPQSLLIRLALSNLWLMRPGGSLEQGRLCLGRKLSG